jgi:hypothetical protein
MSKLDWRSQADYDGLKTMEPEALAWEFLRRNPDYRSLYSTVATKADEDNPAMAQRWGLRFPG